MPDRSTDDPLRRFLTALDEGSLHLLARLIATSARLVDASRYHGMDRAGEGEAFPFRHGRWENRPTDARG